jgi:hypothetical protein
MSSCACRRWGPGTTCEKPIDTPGARELEAKMKTLMAEREVQANFWTTYATNNDKNAPEYNQEPRQCDLNARTSLSNVVATSHITASNSSSQQMRFWN